jgi:hypothetical protein
MRRNRDADFLLGFLPRGVALLQHSHNSETAPHWRADCLVASHSNNWERVMTFTSLLSLEQIIAMKEPFAAVEITDADFNRIENIGDLIRHIEISDERRQH